MRTSTRLTWSMVGAMCAILGCEPTQPKAPVAAEVPVMKSVVLTSSQELALASARHWIARSKERAFSDAILRARSQIMRDEEEQAPVMPPELSDQAERYTFVFSANNHGEREDCGCKRNPLGGLTRRATLLDMVAKTSKDEVAARYWETRIEREGTLFVVDAGDALFKNTTLKSSPKVSQDQALRHAEGVIEGMNIRPPDVLNVGEYDLALGVEVLEALSRRARFPFISANLRKKGETTPLFPGHVIVERDGKKVAYIGLTKQHARVNAYYDQQGVEVDDTRAAYEREVSALPGDVDLVVMLNNEGVPATQALITQLRASGVRVDVALVSNSNLNTAKPKWTEGVPVLEPMSQGKHLGRLDLWITGSQPPVYMNDVPSKLAALDDYRGTWHAYVQTNYQLETLRERIAKERVIVELGQVPTQATKGGEEVALNEAQRTENVTRARASLAQFEAQLGALEQRLALTSEEALRAAAQLDEPVAAHAQGDDWAEVHVVPVLLEIPQERATRRVLDRYKE